MIVNLLTAFVSIMLQGSIIGQDAVNMLGLDSFLEAECLIPDISFIFRLRWK